MSVLDRHGVIRSTADTLTKKSRRRNEFGRSLKGYGMRELPVASSTEERKFPTDKKLTILDYNSNLNIPKPRPVVDFEDDYADMAVKDKEMFRIECARIIKTYIIEGAKDVSPGQAKEEKANQPGQEALIKENEISVPDIKFGYGVRGNVNDDRFTLAEDHRW